MSDDPTKQTPTPRTALTPTMPGLREADDMVGAAVLLTQVILPAIAALGILTPREGDVQRLLLYVASMIDIANVRSYDTGFGPARFGVMAHHVWMAGDRARALREVAAAEMKRREVEAAYGRLSQIDAVLDKKLAEIFERNLKEKGN